MTYLSEEQLILNPFLQAEKKIMAKKTRKWRSHDPPPMQWITNFGGSTLHPVIKIGRLSR